LYYPKFREESNSSMKFPAQDRCLKDSLDVEGVCTNLSLSKAPPTFRMLTDCVLCIMCALLRGSTQVTRAVGVGQKSQCSQVKVAQRCRPGGQGKLEKTGRWWGKL
jgi:hypothetical protein